MTNKACNEQWAVARFVSDSGRSLGLILQAINSVANRLRLET